MHIYILLLSLILPAAASACGGSFFDPNYDRPRSPFVPLIRSGIFQENTCFPEQASRSRSIPAASSAPTSDVQTPHGSPARRSPARPHTPNKSLTRSGRTPSPTP